MSRRARPYSELIHKATDFAAIKHKAQIRKNRDVKIPYISHCAAVGNLLERAGYDEEVVAAGLVHDTIEDAGVSINELKDIFGERVAELVDYVSEQDKSLPWDERKKIYIERLKEAPDDAVAISCADKIHNIWSLILYNRSGGDPWDILKNKSGKAGQIKRFHSLANMFNSRLETHLKILFNEALAILEEEC